MTIYALYGVARAGKDSLHEAAARLAPDRVARVALGDEIKRKADGVCLANWGISAFTQDDGEKQVIRPLLEQFGQEHGMALLGNVIARAQALEDQGRVVFIPRVQNAREMAAWIDVAGAQAVRVVRPGYGPATETEESDLEGIDVLLGTRYLLMQARDLDDVEFNANTLLELAGVYVQG